jgi:SAM-dependent methyltransferase
MLPVGTGDIVLDVGSGGYPYPRADVLLDRIGGQLHRNNFELKIDRPTIFADANKMPLKDSSISFSIASHILEHMSNPNDFLEELARVSKRGYIETPNALFERLYPYEIHCNEIDVVDDCLIIHKKSQPIIDQFLYEFKYLSSPILGLGQIMHKYPKLFHVRYFWEKTIKYKVVNCEINCDWIENIYLNENEDSVTDVSNYLPNSITWRNIGLQVFNICYSYKES